MSNKENNINICNTLSSLVEGTDSDSASEVEENPSDLIVEILDFLNLSDNVVEVEVNVQTTNNKRVLQEYNYTKKEYVIYFFNYS